LSRATRASSWPKYNDVRNTAVVPTCRIDGCVVARETPHRIEHADGVVHTWCAFDAIGIPAALGMDAAAVTTCSACGAELRVVLTHGVPPDGGALRLWLPSGECAHLVDDFCRHTNLYCDAEHLATIVPAGTPGQAVTVADAAALGRDTWRDVSTILPTSGDADGR